MRIGSLDQLLVNTSKFVKSFDISSYISFYELYGSSLHKYYNISFLGFFLFIYNHSDRYLVRYEFLY